MINSFSSEFHYTHTLPSSTELAQRRKEMFTTLESNGDGGIDLSELKAGAPKDGRGPEAAEILKQADTDGNGTIDEQENDSFLSKMEEHRKAGGMPPGPPPTGNGESDDSSDASVSAVFDPLDTNKDGKVSLKELLAAAKRSELSDEAEALSKLFGDSDDSSVTKKEFSSLLRSLVNGNSDTATPTYDENGGKSGAIGALVDSNA